MKCADCQNETWHREAKATMKAAGFCGCALQPAYVYLSRMYERECGDFVKKVAG